MQTNEDDLNFLDIVFGIGEVIEVCGLSSCGKTQICFQLALNVQIPQPLGGLHNEPAQSLYIDCHGDFSTERIHEMAKHLRASVLKQIEKDPNLIKKYRDEFSIEKILSRVQVVRLLDEAEVYLLS